MFATGKNYSSAENHIREQHVAGTFHQQTEVAVDRASVGGADRWKFFRRPLVPFLSNFIYMKKEPQQRQRAEVVERPVSPLTKATGVQTLYR